MVDTDRADDVAPEDCCVDCGNGPLSILDKQHRRRCNCCRNGHSRMYVTYNTKFRPRGIYCSECLKWLPKANHNDGSPDA